MGTREVNGLGAATEDVRRYSASIRKGTGQHALSHPQVHGRQGPGFTLIELLVVIIIIGILAAIAIPVFLNQRKKAVDASLKSDLHNAAVIVEAWAVDHPGEPIAWQEAHHSGVSGVGVLDGLKVSPGNYVAILPSPTVGGWCLYAVNANASKAIDVDHYMAWRSLVGGLDPTLGPPNCA